MVKIDMEMPKKCNDCPFVFYAKNCALVFKQVELNSKPDWCPLIEVEPEPKSSFMKIDIAYNNLCANCSNNPKNGGSGICYCILGQSIIY